MPQNFTNAVLTIRSKNNNSVVDLLDGRSGLKMEDPYWNPNVTQLKGGGTFVNPATEIGQSLVFSVEDIVTETIPISIKGFNQDAAIKTFRKLERLFKQAQDYHDKPYEYDPVWIEFASACNDCLTGYSKILKGTIPSLTNPLGQPFNSDIQKIPAFQDLVLTFTREPFWRGTEPGTIMGPYYNLIKNADFELWTQFPGIEDSQPDSWTDLETTHIAGQNSRQDTVVKNGNHALKVRVSGSTLTGAFKGVTQVVEGTQPQTQYTVLAWVRSEGVSNGAGRILVTYQSQLELYRDTARHGWTLHTGLITTGNSDTVAIHCEIITTAANTDGTVYFDSLMLIEGDHRTDAANGILPYISSSHIVNHWDQGKFAVVGAGDINWVDVWDVPGDVPALVRLEVKNDNIPADLTDQIEVFSKIRIGQRRTKDILEFDNYLDPPGVLDADESSENRLTTGALNNEWSTIVSKIISSGNVVLNNMGRFKVMVRAYDTKDSGDPTLRARVKYFIGVAGVQEKALDEVLIQGIENWMIIDVTPFESMIQDQKFARDIPAQIGYDIQFKRDTGTEVARLDYVLVMPTDGGYFEATIDPPITEGNAVIIDNTTDVFYTVGATFTKTGFRTADTFSTIPRSMVVYKGFLYIGAGGGLLFKFQNNSGIQVQDYGASTIFAMTVYNGVLYIAHAKNVFSSRGSTFSTTADFTISETDIRSMHVFDDKIYLAVNGGNAPIYKWDGTTLTLDFNTNQTRVDSLEVYNNRLYAGTSTGANVYVLDSETNVWTLSNAFAGETEVLSLKVFKEKLYAGTGTNGRIFSFDGNEWTQVVDFSTITRVRSLEVVDDTLYAGGSPADSIQQTTDGTTWEDTYDPESIFAHALKQYEGSLFIANSDTNLDVIAFESLQYKVPNYRGKPFTSPVTKRHRWVFSYDRENFINVATDKALVGFGFVPLYYALRGKG